MALVDGFRAFIFDYGGVLVEYQSEADQERLATLARIPRDIFHKLYWANRLNYDRGDLSRSDYWQALARAAGTQFSDKTIEDLAEADIESWMRFDPPAWEWIRELRGAGKRVAMLSNMPRDLGEALRSRTDRLKSFDHVTLSYETRVVKPDPAAFEACLRGLGARPEETVFFDDSLANVQGAERLGMRGIHVASHEELLQSLRAG